MLPHLLVAKAVQEGRLVRQPCEVCGEARAVAHHDDYARPLAVRWLCRQHHQEWHERNGEGANVGLSPAAVAAGTRIREARQRRGLSVAELARSVPISRNQLANIERGAFKKIRALNAVRICRALEIDVVAVFGGLHAG